jgi:hypothetical protein
MALKVRPELEASNVASSTRVLTAEETARHSAFVAVLAKNKPDAALIEAAWHQIIKIGRSDNVSPSLNWNYSAKEAVHPAEAIRES